MTGDTMEVMPMSPRQSPAGLGNAVVQFLRSRRGRMLGISAVFVVCLLGLFTGTRHTESISDGYKSITTSYHLPKWRPHLPNLPAIISSPLKPSNLTLKLENGDLKHVPAQLTKKTPNFHLVLNSLTDDDDFCRTSLSAMLLNYPPPTVINLFETFESQIERERARFVSIMDYLNNKKLVHGEDLLLVVDGHDTWFQLPSDVMIRQYRSVIADANERLLETYGLNENNVQKYNQTILFGAEKVCEGEDMACRHFPNSILPDDIYGNEVTGKMAALTPARYIDSKMVIGPAKDLKKMYNSAIKHFYDEHSNSGTAQSVIATMFGEQELSRETGRKVNKPKPTQWTDWFDVQLGRTKEVEPEPPAANETLRKGGQYEFSMGIDYTHTVFQSFVYTAEDELMPLSHEASTNLSTFHHSGTPTPPLHIPTALKYAKPPFWAPDLSKHNPSPNEKTAYIAPLALSDDLDKTMPRDTKWEALNLIQNTYTGAIPVALHLSLPPQSFNGEAKKTKRRSRIRAAAPEPHHAMHDAPRAEISWESLWYSGFERALLRKHFRAPQSPIGFHSAAVGGDRGWDQRGGKGGVWTEKAEIWLPWGEVDGVCGTVEHLNKLFPDGKGVWLHESEDDAEKKRLDAEEELRMGIIGVRRRRRLRGRNSKRRIESIMRR
ncbi:hypothetical protein P154DRAFT_153917 [Amniculicola lignicola CBS 123094]|uniref:Uncharacterized protein n=1 Tax=Amniculicola lignicola CBS 123094 TaxID=1392246 RepID=A0A6A5WRZ8_9PLEO|nr:hypothetical protein P154DRAFT_153917 [Amniculicola lignicola CBS 123094]